MCRLLGYLGRPTQLQKLLAEPEHSLIVQSYQPREMTAGLLNADGFGIGWYHPQQQTQPFLYKNTLPIWSDINLPHLGRYIESGCILANVRSATAGQAVDLGNCQPFSYGSVLGIHNGFIENFRQSLYRPIRDRLDDAFYQNIHGTTDSEHILALLWQNLQYLNSDAEVNAGKVDAGNNIGSHLVAAAQKTLTQILFWAREQGVNASLNIVVSDGNQIVAARCATKSPTPSLYWLQDSAAFPNAIVIASEPIFPGYDWIAFPENSILSVAGDRDLEIYEF